MTLFTRFPSRLIWSGSLPALTPRSGPHSQYHASSSSPSSSSLSLLPYSPLILPLYLFTFGIQFVHICWDLARVRTAAPLYAICEHVRLTHQRDNSWTSPTEQHVSPSSTFSIIASSASSAEVCSCFGFFNKSAVADFPATQTSLWPKLFPNPQSHKPSTKCALADAFE